MFLDTTYGAYQHIGVSCSDKCLWHTDSRIRDTFFIVSLTKQAKDLNQHHGHKSVLLARTERTSSVSFKRGDHEWFQSDSLPAVSIQVIGLASKWKFSILLLEKHRNLEQFFGILVESANPGVTLSILILKKYVNGSANIEPQKKNVRSKLTSWELGTLVFFNTVTIKKNNPI